MPTADPSESDTGWSLEGEYHVGKKRADAEAPDACKRRWRGVKGLDPEC